MHTSSLHDLDYYTALKAIKSVKHYSKTWCMSDCEYLNKAVKILKELNSGENGFKMQKQMGLKKTTLKVDGSGG